MFNEWIDAIIATKKLPDYEYSPLREPFNLPHQIDDSGTNASDRIQIDLISKLVFTLIIFMAFIQD